MARLACGRWPDTRTSHVVGLAGHYAAPAQAQWSNRKSLVSRLHLPNVWEVESGNDSDDVIAHHQRMV